MLVILATWWFWICLIMCAGFILAEIFENTGIWVGALVFGALGLHFIADVNVFGFIYDNPGTCAKWLALYFVMGTAWSIFRWWTYVLDARENFRRAKAEFFEENNITGTKIPSALASKFRQSWGYRSDYLPEARYHKARIVRWIMHWPVSVLRFFLDDLIRRIADIIYNAISSVFQSISNFVFRNESIEIGDD